MKALPKERIKQFLTRRKWQVCGAGCVCGTVKGMRVPVSLSALFLLSRKQAKPYWPSTGSRCCLRTRTGEHQRLRMRKVMVLNH